MSSLKYLCLFEMHHGMQHTQFSVAPNTEKIILFLLISFRSLNLSFFRTSHFLTRLDRFVLTDSHKEEEGIKNTIL